MKNIVLIVCSVLLAASVSAQTFVDTTVQNRNVVIEEFTGVNCQFCPDGHKRVNEIIAANPGRVVGINIHQGSYAARYTTQWGDAIARQTGLTGYPAGTVNRHVFSGSKTAVSRDKFSTYSTRIMNMVSPVNVAARATVDLSNRTIEIDIEAYYTSSVAKTNLTVLTYDTTYVYDTTTNDTATVIDTVMVIDTNVANLLNVAVLQDNIIGPQVGAQQWYPEMMVGSQYRHNHMLRDLITGQWGDTIYQTTTGTFVSKHYTYNIPDRISNVEMRPNDLKIVVFIAEGKQEIITGCEAEMTYVGFYNDDLVIEKSHCDIEFDPYMVLHNSSDELITNVQIPYSYSGVRDTLIVTDTIQPYADDTVHLPHYAVDTTPATNASYYVEARMAGFTRVMPETIYDTIYSTDTVVDTIDFIDVVSTGAANRIDLINVYTVEGPLYFILRIDAYGQETTMDFRKQSDCSVLYHDGPFTYDANRNYNGYYYHLDPAEAGLYILGVYDEYGDGNKGFQLKDGAGNAVFSNSGNFGSEAIYFLNITNNGSGQFVGIESATNATTLNVYPNPVIDELRVECGEAIRNIEVLDVTGRTVYSTGNCDGTIDTDGWQSGMYIIRVTTDNGMSVQKFVKQ